MPDVKADLSIVGLDLKKDLANTFSENSSLDDVLQTLEKGKPSEIAIEKAGIVFSITDDAVNRFLKWVLENGTKYNHEFGLLNLDNKVAQVEIDKVKNTLTAQK